MVSLLDIAEQYETVAINGNPIKCYGISAKGIVQLIVQYPEMKKLLSGQSIDFSLDTIAKIAPNAVASIIAMGTHNEGQEEVAANLPFEYQYDLIAAIINMTMPGGAGPFVDRLTKMFGQVSGFAEGIQTPATISPSQSKA